MVWADERPIDRPRVRKARPGEVPGWKVSVDYDSGTRTETWQDWRTAVERAGVAARSMAAEWIEASPGAPSPEDWEAVHRYRAVVPVLDVYGEAAS
jgi:hypothetical protein